MKQVHIPVLLEEVLKLTKPKKDETVVDLTVGDGGHARRLCAAIGTGGTLLGIDQDPKQVVHSTKSIAASRCKAHIIQGNFKDIKKIMEERKLVQANIFLFDLGISSRQLADTDRGLSFNIDANLDMRMDPKNPVTAEVIVNSWSKGTLVDILSGFGEERYAKRITEGIASARSINTISTTRELVEIVKKSVPKAYRHRRIHPATKTFQALRIAVNEELTNLSETLPQSWRLLAKGGRLAVISFHSLEDRIVKKFFNSLQKSGEGELLTKKPVRPTEKELLTNPRSRSARLRVIKKH